MNAVAGRSGKDVRSDCRVEIARTTGGGLDIQMKSKVEVQYGEQNRALVAGICSFYGLDNITVSIEDSGALPYALAARVETAIRRLVPDEKREYLLPVSIDPVPQSRPDRLRRSRLYLPGNDPKLAINAGIHGADAVILDLEDSVSPAEKDAARMMVRNTLRAVDFNGAERMVRINQLPLGLTDLEAVVPQQPDLILVPKCETADQIKQVEFEIERIKKLHDIDRDIHLMPIIESALGAINAYSIGVASKHIVALSIGLEDYTADIGAERTNEGRESLWMRGAVLNAARAAGLQPIDTVFSDINDMDGLRASVIEAKSLGFDGKGCIHPRQVAVVHEAFAPGTKELEKARKVMLAYEEAQRKGLGVVALGSKMIDAPVVKRAARTIDLAIMSGLLTQNWREEENNG
jgi:citrate lyase subunit beta/citryl-CoA lyase